MPIYEYECRSCGHALDALQKIDDPVLKDCPECGEPQLRRLISAPRFRLKGGGWYETDFKTENKRNLAGDGGSGEKEKSGDKEKASPEKPSSESTQKDATAKPKKKPGRPTGSEAA